MEERIESCVETGSLAMLYTLSLERQGRLPSREECVSGLRFEMCFKKMW